MAKDRVHGPERDVNIEERGVFSEVVVPIVSGGIGGALGGAASALVASHLGKPNDPPPPPPPQIELPPGVDRE